MTTAMRSPTSLEVIYKLLEGSWEEGAVVRDREARVFTSLKRFMRSVHHGKYFHVPGYGLNRTITAANPVLYQAGASVWQELCGLSMPNACSSHAQTKTILRNYILDIEERLRVAGRSRADIRIYNLLTVIVDETDVKARDRFRDYLDYVSYDGSLTFMSGWTGVVFSHYAP